MCINQFLVSVKKKPAKKAGFSYLTNITEPRLLNVLLKAFVM